MQIYVHKNNQQVGPYTEAEIKAQLAAGTITLEDHVWWQGQANWLPLGQTSLVSPGAVPLPSIPAVPLPGHPAVMSTAPRTSTMAIWSLVCACLSILCGVFTCIPAIILGHLSLSEIKRNPALGGRGLALAGTVIGYIFLVLSIIGLIALATLGDRVKEVFNTINSQMAAQAANNSDESTTNSDQSTNAPDQSTPAATPTNSPDQSTNSDSSTNTPTATPMTQ